MPQTNGPRRDDTPWHTLAADDLRHRLGTGPDGLTDAEAAERLARVGPNELQAFGHASAWQTLASQFKNVLIVILLTATLLSGLLGHALEAIVIAVIVLFAVLLGFVQEYRAERSLEALRAMAAPLGHVRRSGVERSIPAREVVPGDIVLLRAGDRVPADARITRAANLSIDEAALTGESAAVEKAPDVIEAVAIGLGDRVNMAYAGTLVTYGRGEAVVVATGPATEFGRISALVQTVEAGRTPPSGQPGPARRHAWQGGAGHCGPDRGARTVARTAAARDVHLWHCPRRGRRARGPAGGRDHLPGHWCAAHGEASGARQAPPRCRDAGQHVGDLLGQTGTLTRNEMTLRRAVTPDTTAEILGVGYEPAGDICVDGASVAPPASVLELLRAGTLSSDARLVFNEGRWHIDGDPTEGALVVAAAKAGLDQADLNAGYPRVHEVPFSSERRRMTTIHRVEGGMMAYSKGAADVILRDCARQWNAEGDAPMGDGDRTRLLASEREMAAQGLRVLAIASKRVDRLDEAECTMTFLGLVGIMDPPRAEAASAVRMCRDAGITAVMITGDHPLTARAIASEVGLLESRRVVSGADLAAMSDADLAREVGNIGAYARVSPADKLRVVSAWQARGDVVAMTGDGVNDAPALKKADVGIAMGITGTDVSKEAAGVTLLDDNFATIVAAVDEGRIVFSNIRKYLTFLLSSNVGEILLMAGAALGGLPLPVTAVQILYVNLATDGLPALALAVDPPEPDLMRRRPRDPRAGIFTRPLLALLLIGGFWTAAVNLGLFAWLLHQGRPLQEAMTLTFVTLVLIQFFNAYNYRSDRYSVMRRPFANHWLNLAVGWELILLGLVIYIPFLQRPFGTFTLGWQDWVLSVGLAFSIVPVLEMAKWLKRRGAFGNTE